jgi:hypothetical protein
MKKKCIISDEVLIFVTETKTLQKTTEVKSWWEQQVRIRTVAYEEGRIQEEDERQMLLKEREVEKNSLEGHPKKKKKKGNV